MAAFFSGLTYEAMGAAVRGSVAWGLIFGTFYWCLMVPPAVVYLGVVGSWVWLGRARARLVAIVLSPSLVALPAYVFLSSGADSKWVLPWTAFVALASGIAVRLGPAPQRRIA